MRASCLLPIGALTAALAFAPARVPAQAAASATDTVPAERLAARQWFRDARLGLFIHWGVYSILGQGEWVMENGRVPVGTYQWMASTFNPVKFSAREWVSLAKAAGMRYITITARHHDGFSMYASEHTRYDITEWTPFKRDPLAELAEECRRQGIKLFFYYSQLDWYHPDYWPRGRTGQHTMRAESGEWTRYLDYMDRQIEELLTKYGPIGGIWLDGMWDKPDADWRLSRTYGLIHRLQPSALVIPNHHRPPLPGEDVQTFEQDLPGANTTGFNTTQIGTLPLETALTMNTSWGFNLADSAFKSSKELIGYLVRAAGADANLLLNVGPKSDGTIQLEAVRRLNDIGFWLQTFGPTIYGTRGGPVRPQGWGATTQRNDSVFVHVLSWEERALAVPAFEGRVTRATSYPDGRALAFTQTPSGVTLVTLPEPRANPLEHRILVLQVRRGND